MALMHKRWLVLAVVVGCGGGTDDPPTSETVEIIGRDWTVGPGQELYKCIGIRAERDMYINQFETPNPLGEHHTVLTVTDELGGIGNTQLGESDCAVLSLDLQMLYASGVGTPPVTLPEGVALKVRAGQFLHLNLHLFNTTDADLSAHSGIVATLIDPVPPEREAEMVFTGTTAIDVPAGETRTMSGGCTFTRDATLFAYWPHMHQYATHQKLALTIGGVTRMVHDAPYDFREQHHLAFEPLIDVRAGDSVRTECTYTNTSSTTLRWGDSSNQEMCFTGLYRYPKQAISMFDCTEGGRP